MTSIVPQISAGEKQTPAGLKSYNDNSQSAFTEILEADLTYVVSRINMPVRCTLPLHTNRQVSKHITVISGILHITIGDDVMVLEPDESLYIPQGAIYGFENRANNTAMLICVDYIA